MPDTIRTKSAVLALLADNTSGDISPQDLRDGIVSLYANAYGYQFTPPVLGDFTAINSASGSTVGDGILLPAPSRVGTNDFKVYAKAAPATPYTIEAVILPMAIPANYNSCGLVFRQSSDGKLSGFGPSAIAGLANGTVSVFSMTDPTTYGATPFQTPYYCANAPVFLRIADNGTNRIYSISSHGHSWVQLYSVGRTSHITADQVGFFIDGNATYDSSMLVLSWKEA